jgi:hypothetical protein
MISAMYEKPFIEVITRQDSRGKSEKMVRESCQERSM